MPETDSFWDFYWELRLQAMENLGKREAILAASRLVRSLFDQLGRPVRVLELGCGEGQIVGTLADSHARWVSSQQVIGIDYKPQSVARCRRDFPGWQFVDGNITDAATLAKLGQYDVVLLVNTLHEVFTFGASGQPGEVDVLPAKQRAEEALGGAVSLLAPHGRLLLFDGLEPPGDPQKKLTIRFMDAQARDDFEMFTQTYKPFRIHYRQSGGPLRVELSRHDFARYITKSIFLRKGLWQTEQFESYQYFNEAEFRAAFARQGLTITELRTLTVNSEKWRRLVVVETPGEEFPQEHILILAQRSRK